MENNVPSIIEETDDFAVVYKPPKMHSAPHSAPHSTASVKNNEDVLFNWIAANSVPVFDLVHRLDFETHGLVLAAKNPRSFEFFKDLQDRGEFIKEYSAICSCGHSVSMPGFPLPPDFSGKPAVIESFFRPFGPGRKQVRPVIIDGKKHREVAKDKGNFYRTEIIDISEASGINGNAFTVRIRRGFRHQIRCHLCWAGYPILNDPLYGLPSAGGELALRAHALFFTDPSGRRREYGIDPIIKTMLEKPHI